MCVRQRSGGRADETERSRAEEFHHRWPEESARRGEVIPPERWGHPHGEVRSSPRAKTKPQRFDRLWNPPSRQIKRLKGQLSVFSWNVFVWTRFRWGRRWTLTCWSLMKTPWRLFFGFTAGELEDGGKPWKTEMKSFWTCFYLFIYFFQGFGEAVELPDPAGFLPEPGLRLQSPAGLQIHLNSFFKGVCFISVRQFYILWRKHEICI